MCLVALVFGVRQRQISVSRRTKERHINTLSDTHTHTVFGVHEGETQVCVFMCVHD